MSKGLAAGGEMRAGVLRATCLRRKQNGLVYTDLPGNGRASGYKASKIKYLLKHPFIPLFTRGMF